MCIAVKKGPWIAIVTSEMSKATSKSVQFCKSSCGDEPPGSVRSEIADSTYNLSPISLTWPFTKTNVASPAQVKLY